jgi:hypothetical protein
MPPVAPTAQLDERGCPETFFSSLLDAALVDQKLYLW